MATARLLTELARQFESESSLHVAVESVGGVDAAKRVRAGEAFDVVVLAADVIDQLTDEGRVVQGSRTDIVRSPIAVAVRRGAPRPDISSPDAVRRAVAAAASVGYSTGPSGTYLQKLFERWDLGEAFTSRVVVAPPGVPVGSLVARGDLELGFQQLSEFVSLEGIDVVGLLPAEIQSVTTFSGGIAQTSAQPGAARGLLDFMAGPAVVELKKKQGMEAA